MAGVTDQQWIRLEPLLSKPQHQQVDPSPEATGKCLTALPGSGQLGPMAVWPGPKKRPRPWKDQRRQERMMVVDGQAVPIGADLDSASASKIKLLEATIEKIVVPRKVVVDRSKILSAS